MHGWLLFVTVSIAELSGVTFLPRRTTVSKMLCIKFCFGGRFYVPCLWGKSLIKELCPVLAAPENLTIFINAHLWMQGLILFSQVTEASASHLTAYFTSSLYVWCILVLSRPTHSYSEPLPRAIMSIVNGLQTPERHDKGFPPFTLAL